MGNTFKGVCKMKGKDKLMMTVLGLCLIASQLVWLQG